MEVKSVPLIKLMLERELQQLDEDLGANRHAAVARILNVYTQLYTSVREDLKVDFAQVAAQKLVDVYDEIANFLPEDVHVTWTANPRVVSERYPPSPYDNGYNRYIGMTWPDGERTYAARHDTFVRAMSRRYTPEGRLGQAFSIRQEVYGPSQVAPDLIQYGGGLACTAVAVGVMPEISATVARQRASMEVYGMNRAQSPVQYLDRIRGALKHSEPDVRRAVRAALEAKQKGCTGSGLFRRAPSVVDADEAAEIAYADPQISIRKDIPELANNLTTLADGTYVITFPPSNGLAGRGAVGFTLGFTIWTLSDYESELWMAQDTRRGNDRQRAMVLYDSHDRTPSGAGTGLVTLFWWDPRTLGHAITADYLLSVVGQYTLNVGENMPGMLDDAVAQLAADTTNLRKELEKPDPAVDVDDARATVERNQATLDAKGASEAGAYLAVFKLTNVDRI